MSLIPSLFAVLALAGCGSPRAEHVPSPPLGLSTAAGPADPTVPPPDSDQMVPDKPKQTSMLEEVAPMAIDAGAPIDGMVLPPGDAGAGSGGGTGSGTDTGKSKTRPMK